MARRLLTALSDAAEFVDDLSIGSSADDFILGGRPLSELQDRVDAEGAALLAGQWE